MGHLLISDLAADLAGAIIPPGAAGAESPNPYLGFLAGADYLLVSADSVNMLSEARATGKPRHTAQHGGAAVERLAR